MSIFRCTSEVCILLLQSESCIIFFYLLITVLFFHWISTANVPSLLLFAICFPGALPFLSLFLFSFFCCRTQWLYGLLPASLSLLLLLLITVINLVRYTVCNVRHISYRHLFVCLGGMSQKTAYIGRHRLVLYEYRINNLFIDQLFRHSLVAVRKNALAWFRDEVRAPNSGMRSGLYGWDRATFIT